MCSVIDGIERLKQRWLTLRKSDHATTHFLHEGDLGSLRCGWGRGGDKGKGKKR